MPITRSWQREINEAEASQGSQPKPVNPPIHLAQLIEDILDGRVPEVDMNELATMFGVCDAVVRVVEQRAGRTLDHSERVHVETEAGCAFNRRRETMRANLRETQERLHQPGRMAS